MSGENGVFYDEGRTLYRMLLEEATDLLRNLGRVSPEDLTQALRRRQSIMGSLQEFDARLRSVAAGPGDAEFRTFREEITRQILEVDGLVVGLAQDKQLAIRSKISSVAKSASAGRAYDARGFGGRSHLRTSM